MSPGFSLQGERINCARVCIIIIVIIMIVAVVHLHEVMGKIRSGDY